MAPNSPQSLEEMREQLARLQEAIKEAEVHQREQAMGQIQELMYKNSITLEDLQQAMTPATKKKGTRAKPKAKYRDPESGQEWSGMGKPPMWIRDKDRDQFLIAA
jgi:DNA-binding protein H-NS